MFRRVVVHLATRKPNINRPVEVHWRTVCLRGIHVSTVVREKKSLLEKAEEKISKMEEEVQAQLEMKRAKSELEDDKRGIGLQERLTEKRGELRDRLQVKKVEIQDRGDKAKSRAFINVFNRFFAYLKTYNDVLQRAFPDKVVKTYRIFSSGSSHLFKDMKVYLRVNHLLSNTSDINKAYKCLSRHDLEVYLDLPWNLARVGPVLLVSALPLAQNVTFPLALLYPRTFLSTHFWSTQDFHQHLRERIVKINQTYPSIREELMKAIYKDRGSEYFVPLRKIIKNIDAGCPPSHVEILEIKHVFARGGSLELGSLSSRHAKLLVSLHNLSYSIYTHRTLQKYGSLLLAMDRAMDREGIDLLDKESLVRLSTQRGLDGLKYNSEDLIEYILVWNIISTQLTDDDMSLYLHLPFLLAYTPPGI